MKMTRKRLAALVGLAVLLVLMLATAISLKTGWLIVMVVTPAAPTSATHPPGLAPTSPQAEAKTSPTPAAGPSETPGTQRVFPVRAAFYYPWFPEAWKQSGMNPFTHYHPVLGFYSQDDPAVVQKQIEAMQYGKIQLGISSWWGQGHPTDQRFPSLLKAGEAAHFSWAVYMENEGQGNPTPDQIRADLTYIRDHYASSPAYYKINGRFLVFAYNDARDNCDMPKRWKEANTVGAYVVLKVFAGYRACPDQPDAWHQYAPANSDESMGKASYTISPGFNKATEPQPRLARDLTRWSKSIKDMMASGADFQLITSFNEWGEGTSVEDAQEWTSSSGYGLYLDALHSDGDLPVGKSQP